MTEKRLLYAILAGYVVLATIYSVVTPIFEASDELWHYPMVKYLADNGLQLPPQDPANPGFWRQEGSQPPLYYMMAAVLTAGIDTSDMETVRRVNPHANIGEVWPDGNVNMMAHRVAEAFPWRGTVLAVHIARFFSIVLGLGTVIITYLLAREIFPEYPAITLGATALVAFLPMFLFISGSVNNDNLSNLLGNWLTLLIVRLVKTTSPLNPLSVPERGENKEDHQQKFAWKRYVLLGVVTGAGLLAKLNIGFLIPLVGLALLVVSIRQRDWKPLVLGGGIAGILTIGIAGWWYVRNAQLYGDPTGLNRFLEMVGKRGIPANAAQLWSERHSFTQAYWGFFGGVNVPLPDWVYLICNVIGGVGLVSAVVFITKTIVKRDWKIQQWLPAAVTIIWPVVTFVSYLRWTAETPASQGRLVFGALSSIALWMAVGLVWWLPKQGKTIVMGGVAAWFAVIAVITPFWIISPAYTKPEQNRVEGVETSFVEPSGDGSIGIQSARVVSDNIQPESYAEIELNLQVEKVLGRDWSLFVHLVTPDGVIIAQRDIYPGGGTLATSDLAVGTAWTNRVAIWVPKTAYAPMTLDVEIGWYDLKTGERMHRADGSELLNIGQVELTPKADAENLDVPNPVHINFGNEIELVGYSLTDLSPAAGDTIELTLYWRGLQKITNDYKVFANILDPDTLTKYAASDGMPVNWQAPTSTWTVGTVIEDTHTLVIDPNAPPGMYKLELGLYLSTPDGSFERLRVVTPDGGMADNYIYLTPVRIEPK